MRSEPGNRVARDAGPSADLPFCDDPPSSEESEAGQDVGLEQEHHDAIRRYDGHDDDSRRQELSDSRLSNLPSWPVAVNMLRARAKSSVQQPALLPDSDKCQSYEDSGDGEASRLLQQQASRSLEQSVEKEWNEEEASREFQEWTQG